MYRRSKTAVSLFLCFVFLFSYTASPSMAGKTATGSVLGTLKGVVKTVNASSVIAGAKITAICPGSGTYSTMTQTDGSYSLSLPAGYYTVTCTATGYNPVTANSSLKSNRTSILNFNLSATEPVTGNIKGTIVDASTGISVSGATVEVAGLTTVSDGQGNYYIDNLPVGTYELTVQAAGYNTEHKTVNINSTDTLQYSIALLPLTSNVKIRQISANLSSFVEGSLSSLELSADLEGTPISYQWSQVKGPKVPITHADATSATVDVSSLEVAADVQLTFRLTVAGADNRPVFQEVTVFVQAKDMTPILGQNVQIGGASTAVNKFIYNGTDWAIFNIGNKLCTAPIDTTSEPASSIHVPGFIYDIDLVTYNNVNYALLSCGSEGIVVVDITDPKHMAVIRNVKVNYYQDNITFTEGGGSILYNNTISSTSAPITATEIDGINLFIADSEFGIHRTSLANLLSDAGPVLESDGTLKIEMEKFTLQYAGENPWGGPVDLKLKGGKLFACLGCLGMGIFDPATLEQIGGYNLYTDSTVKEDWFMDMNVREVVQKDAVTGDVYVDDFTGLPDFRQASFEILQVMKKNVSAPTPWADFDRYGKYYYKAQSVDIAEFNGRTIAYIAYALGGLIAVDITGYENATPANFINGKYLGYIPAVPANGPKEPTGTQSQSLLPYYGAGMLKESGVIDVRVKDNYVYLTDHFAGLLIIDNAATPDVSWKGSMAPYNNDTDGIPGNHWPDYEFVTSFDMSPYDPFDNESMPKWMYESPCLLVTTEINGHGNSLLLMDNMSVNTANNIDLLECAGAGGFNFIDIVDLTAQAMNDRFRVPVYFPTTGEIGAYGNGTAGQAISIGHSSGIASSDQYIYLADGPHGISAWRIVDENGYPTDNIHLVANTLQDEYPEIVNGVNIYPAAHAINVVFDPVNKVAWSGSASLGLRRVNVAPVEAGQGQPGNPLLLPLAPTDCFEHNAEWGTVKPVQYQDHAYDVAIKGNYAFVADGSNGLTVYDITKDPTNPTGGFLVSNIGAGYQQPPLGTASGIDLWTDQQTGKSYAFLACGPRGIGVVDITDVKNMQLVKVFEPIKLEEGKVGAADGQAVDVKVVGDHAYFSYDSFGVICYKLSDLIAPLPDGISPTDVWKKSNTGQLNYDYRPQAVSRFKLQYVPGYEDWSGGAVKMDYTLVNGKLTFFVAFAEAGLLKIDWTDAANPVLKAVAPTVSECTDVTVSNGRLFVADGTGGMLFFK